MADKKDSEREVYAGRVVTLRLKHLVQDDGSVRLREVVEHAAGAAVVAVDAEATCCSCASGGRRSTRPCSSCRPGWSTPASRRSSAPVASYEEETGFAAATVEPLLSFYPSPGFCTELMHIFVAHGSASRRQARTTTRRSSSWCACRSTRPSPLMLRGRDHRRRRPIGRPAGLLQDVERPFDHRALRSERVVGRGQAAQQGIDHQAAASAAGHDPVSAVAAVQVQPVDVARPEQRAVVGGVGVLAGLQEPVQRCRRPTRAARSG